MSKYTRTELLEVIRPFARLGIEKCQRCEGTGKHETTKAACHTCGGIGELVSTPHPDEVRAAKLAVAHLIAFH